MIHFVKTPDKIQYSRDPDCTVVKLSLTTNEVTIDSLCDLFVDFASAIGLDQEQVRRAVLEAYRCADCEFKGVPV